MRGFVQLEDPIPYPEPLGSYEHVNWTDMRIDRERGFERPQPPKLEPNSYSYRMTNTKP